MSASNPIADAVAIAGVGTTEFRRDANEETLERLVLRACVAALEDAGLTPQDIDGVCGSTISPQYLQSALGIPELTWWTTSRPLAFHVIEAMNAVFSGSCSTALVCHPVYRHPSTSRNTAADPFRARAAPTFGHQPADVFDTLSPVAGYAAWAGRYLHDFNLSREVFGLIALNSRSNAAHNEHAVMRTPLTMDDYMQSRMVRSPLAVLDMDLPVDGADALVITSTDRARDLPQPVVTVHAATTGQQRYHEEDQCVDLRHTGQDVVMKALWGKSSLRLDDIDLFYPYDGFTIIAASWLENVGYCERGEALDFMRDNWDKDTDRLCLNGRVLVNTHGGSLSEGATQGTGHIREAVTQLRGQAGDRQSAAASTALVTPGGFFFNSGGLIFRRA